MKILFCNAGWMNRYDGLDGDVLINGGSYNEEKTGHEVCNFTLNKGFYYSFVKPGSGSEIGIDRIEKSKKDYVDDVTVIWTATLPGPKKGTVIVGWHKKATVYRSRQKIPSPTKTHTKNNIDSFYIKAPASQATLIPADERTFIVPRKKNFLGQSHLWYADRDEAQNFKKRVIKYIKNTETDTPDSQLPSLPYSSDYDPDTEAIEGNSFLTTHLSRERSKKLVDAKKRQVLKNTGKLCCDACGFNFKKTYGEIGDGFCEVHHIKPLSKTNTRTKTTLDDLAVLCSNCHRIIHKTKPLMSVTEFRETFLSSKPRKSINKKP